MAKITFCASDGYCPGCVITLLQLELEEPREVCANSEQVPVLIEE